MLLLGVAAAVVGLMMAVCPTVRAANCSQLADYDYNGACGPEFESPAWGDAAGWTDPSKYSTVQLADIAGDGTDELIARNDDGVEIWTFDTAVGQWRPAIGANRLPEVLRDFHSPAQTADVRGSWQDPAAYSTIQTADLFGDGEREILADREPGGVDVWRYSPPSGTKSIDGGSWSLDSNTQGLLPNPPAPSQYLTLHAEDAYSVGGEGISALTDQNAYWYYDPGSGFVTTPPNYPPNQVSTSSDPKYYLDNVTGTLPFLDQDNNNATVMAPATLYRTANGVGAEQFGVNGIWQQIGPSPTSGGQCQSNHSCSPFPDTNCSGPASCLGASPSYYETMRTATQLLGSNDANGYVLGRLQDGLHVYALKNYTSASGQPYQGWDSSIPVLTALADSSSGYPPPGEWSSIRTGDITGDGHTDVLAVVNGQLLAWELESSPSGPTWTELPANPALNLGGSMWQANAAYYSTLQVGPVAAGQPDAVIARGPFGVRTWFYNVNGSGGWTSLTPQDPSSYPQFTGGGEAAAWNELNAQAQVAPPGTVRDEWTNSPAPSDNQLTNLNNEILQFAGCTGETSANPPAYSSCAAPSGSSGFTSSDWTKVVNETLAEIYDVTQATDFFTQLRSLNNDTFLAQGAELPAISSSVAALGQAAGNNGIQVNPKALWAAGLGVAGEAAGFLDPVAGAALEVASYLAALIPSATPEVTGPSFSTTLDQLQNDFAGAVSDAGKAVDTQSYEVRRNYSMLRLITQLTAAGGPWSNINDAGLSGSMQEGFALWAYKQLLPTVLERDVITNCSSNGATDPSNGDHVTCNETNFSGAVGSPPNFTYLNSPHTSGQPITNSWPCWGFAVFVCSYTHPPTGTVSGPGTDIATKVWGPLSDICNFNGTPETEWTFDCNLGVNPLLSTDATGGPANGWNFPTCTGSPEIYASGVEQGNAGTCTSASSASVSTGAVGRMRLTATVGLPAGFHLRSAKLDDRHVLYERRGRGKLLTRRSGQGLGTVRLTSGGPKRIGSARSAAVLGSPRNAPPIALTLHRIAPRRARLTLTLRHISVKVPYGCQRIPASTSMALQPFRVETSLTLSDGHVSRTVSLPAQWKCVRDRGGAVTGMRTLAPRTPAQHSGLDLSITGPRRVTPGSVATYTVRVHNKRRRPHRRGSSSLWHILVHGRLIPVADRRQLTPQVPAPVVRRLRELRRGKTKVLRIPVRIPSASRRASPHRVCVAALAIADSARPASARVCSLTATHPRHAAGGHAIEVTG
jgi:hypothetical protein